MLTISKLKLSIKNKNIIEDLSLTVNSGTCHIIMGPNGNGKSTLLQYLSGNDTYIKEKGDIFYFKEDLTLVERHERALKGIFLSPQYPPSIPGLANATFLKEALNAKRKYRQEEPIDSFSFLKELKSKAKLFHFPDNYTSSSFNDGLSGGEKKRNEMLQISILEPDLILLDEIDSGLDIEAIQEMAQFINSFKKINRSFLIVTHYPEFAKLLNPDFVHILKSGKIIKTGGKELIDEIEEKGFNS